MLSPSQRGRYRTPTFECVVAADDNGGIGRAGGMAWHLPKDLKFFREYTTRARPGRMNAVIMGRRTWDALLPRFRPLPNRLNIVITRDPSSIAYREGAHIVRSLDEALAVASADEHIDSVFVIGGGEIYRQAFEHPACAKVVLTRVKGHFSCDTFIPTDLPARFKLNDRTCIADGEIDTIREIWTAD